MRPDHEGWEGGQILSRALKALRRRRGLRVSDMAARMAVAGRTYEYFEAGGPEVNVRRVHAAAQILEADGHALLAAAEIGSPEFAVRCADNKLMTILLMALQDFDAEVGDGIALLDAQTLLTGFRRIFREFGAVVEDRERLMKAWESRGAAE